MNCDKFKIWLNKASDTELKNPDTELKQHLLKCKTCERKLEYIVSTKKYMDFQKQSNLPDNISKNIISQLEDLNRVSTQKKNTAWKLSRIAAILIISSGIFAGILTGNVLLKKNKSNNSFWSTEFASLSNESDFYTYLFE